MNKENRKTQDNVEVRHVTIYGYTRQQVAGVMKHFINQLPDSVKLTIDSSNLVTRIVLTGEDSGVELLRFKMNRYQQNLNQIFSEDVVTLEDKSVSQVMGELLEERELTISTAESCTGGNLAHKITQMPGSSKYFLGSVVSYANDVKANVLKVSRGDLDRYGAVSKQVAESMAKGVGKLMNTDCAIATTGIAGPDGGSRFKPVGTVWIAVKCLDRIVSECVHFEGDRDAVIQGASNHGMVMLINLLRNSYVMQEDFNDE